MTDIGFRCTFPAMKKEIADSTGWLDFSCVRLHDKDDWSTLRRKPHYVVFLTTSGQGVLHTEKSMIAWEAPCIFGFSPYQPHWLEAEGLTGYALSFHPDFLCVYKHHEELSCNGVLFDALYASPIIPLTSQQSSELMTLAGKMEVEKESGLLAHQEVIVSWLKIFLITASRIRLDGLKTFSPPERPVRMQELQEAIERNFRAEHTPAFYANLLHLTTRSLGRVVRMHLGKTLGDLIAERIVLEAKRELYLTSRSVKMIAHDLGFSDELYFSRFFRQRTGVSPQRYRDTVGFAKAEQPMP
jgi:AraC family transcriptional activator of pobA